MESPGLKLEASQRCLEPRPLCLCMLPEPCPAAGGAREQGKVGKPVSRQTPSGRAEEAAVKVSNQSSQLSANGQRE